MTFDEPVVIARFSELPDREPVGIALFGPYVLAVELASLLLLGALVAAHHLGRDDHH